MKTEAFVFDAYGTLYDVQSVSKITCEKFPRHGELITQVWRLKQLEYTWLRSLMNSYRSFWDITEESLIYTLDAVGVESDAATRAQIMDKYLHLDPHPDCHSALDALAGVPLAILSNGNQGILDTLVENTGLDRKLEATISVDKVGIFKPHAAAYELVEERLNVKPENVVFVSSNAFDACAAKNFGFRVAWIERVTRKAMNREVDEAEHVGPSTMFKLLRMQMEDLGMEPDYRLTSLNELVALR
ncbi:haloacid dehalogenase type II [Profundibacterium mesophilum]|uniref:(S)-2-haloacid dehalogenase n=1 Tax=Profundibacterium mesophilum KAUST100406-0324 TaxID=1037889 RepID=A0A921NXA1_9RHOB|nr:haloacid dehalogenase type II [Profundibacterium mesophilum]KAF0677110.1 2-haloalkanoic acid dehalogenase [Profundibacterium mesophilum KAUST100406-0324]